MRLIGTIAHEKDAQRFSAYLQQQGIENRCEPGGQIWVSDEDRLAEAEEALKKFCAHPADPCYDILLPEKEEQSLPGDEPEAEIPSKRSLSAPVTMLLLALCIFAYVLNFLQEMQIKETKQPEEVAALVLTPVQETLFFDLPPAVGQTHSWEGLYNIVFLKLKGEDVSEAEGPLFTQIRKGELWRLFSPCILHLNFLHIFFNMIWLWMLGRPIEARIGSIRLLLFTLIVGILTNTAQYLMSGPLFLGFSGIVMGWAGFIWMREKIAPWEGYPLQRTTLLFLALFIFAMLGLQIVSFVLQVFTPIAFVISIANTAHIAGFILGVLFGCLPCFAWRVR